MLMNESRYDIGWVMVTAWDIIKPGLDLEESERIATEFMVKAQALKDYNNEHYWMGVKHAIHAFQYR